MKRRGVKREKRKNQRERNRKRRERGKKEMRSLIRITSKKTS